MIKCTCKWGKTMAVLYLYFRWITWAECRLPQQKFVKLRKIHAVLLLKEQMWSTLNPKLKKRSSLTFFCLWRGDLFRCLLKAHRVLEMHKIVPQYNKCRSTPTCKICVLDYSIMWGWCSVFIFVYISCTNVTLAVQPTLAHLTCELSGVEGWEHGMIKMAKGKMTELNYQVCVGEWMVVLMEKSSWSYCWKTYSAELQLNAKIWRVCRQIVPQYLPLLNASFRIMAWFYFIELVDLIVI